MYTYTLYTYHTYIYLSIYCLYTCISQYVAYMYVLRKSQPSEKIRHNLPVIRCSEICGGNSRGLCSGYKRLAPPNKIFPGFRSLLSGVYTFMGYSECINEASSAGELYMEKRA